MEAVLTDTNIVIEYLRSRDKALMLLIKLMKQFDMFVSSITEFELFLGAKTDRHVYDLEMFFDEADVLPFDFGCGRIASDIWKGLRQKTSAR